jgi:hypothetical protein
MHGNSDLLCGRAHNFKSAAKLSCHGKIGPRITPYFLVPDAAFFKVGGITAVSSI